MKIDLLWTAAIAKLRFIKSSVGTEMVGVTGIVEAIVMVLGLVGAALAAATVQG